MNRDEDLIPHAVISRLVDAGELERIKRDPEFARALLVEAGSLFLQGEPAIARVILRNLVTATVGFEGLAAEMTRSSKSLHRMLSPSGNPSMDNLAAIFDAIRRTFDVAIEVRVVTST